MTISSLTLTVEAQQSYLKPQPLSLFYVNTQRESLPSSVNQNKYFYISSLLGVKKIFKIIENEEKIIND